MRRSVRRAVGRPMRALPPARRSLTHLGVRSLSCSSAPSPRHVRRRARQFHVSLELLILALVILPIGGFAVTALTGRRLGKQAHWIPVLAIFAAWLIAMGLAYQVLTGAAPPSRGRRRRTATRSTGSPGSLPAGSSSTSASGRPADGVPADRGDDHRPAGPRLFHRVHEPRPGVLALLRVPQPVHVLDAPACPRRLVAGRVRGLGAGRLVSYLLIGFWYRKRSRRWPPRRRSSSTASATSGSPSGSWPSS